MDWLALIVVFYVTMLHAYSAYCTYKSQKQHKEQMTNHEAKIEKLLEEIRNEIKRG